MKKKIALGIVFCMFLLNSDMGAVNEKQDITDVKTRKAEAVDVSLVSGFSGNISGNTEVMARSSTDGVMDDDHILRIDIPAAYLEYFVTGMDVAVKFPLARMTRTGKVRHEDGRMTIFVPNRDMRIVPKMKFEVTVEKKIKGAVIIDSWEFRSDAGGIYVFIVKDGTARKTYIESEKFKGSSYIVISGVDSGDILVSPVVDTGLDEFPVIRTKNKKRGPVAKSAVKKNKVVAKKRISTQKKFGFVASAGMSVSKSEDLISKNEGIDGSVLQYAELHGNKYTSTGEFKENMTGMPLSFTVNYRLSDGLFLKFGGEFSSIGNSSTKSFSVSWPEFTETIDYSIKQRVTNIVPFIGIEKRFSSFGVYALAGLNFSGFKYNSELDLNDGAYSMSSSEEISVSGTGIALSIGAKYEFRINDKFGIIAKIEYAVRKVGSYSGDKTMNVSDSLGNHSSGTESGDLYIYQIDPYGLGSIDWWDIHSSSPSGMGITGTGDFSISLSSVRLFVGFSF